MAANDVKNPPGNRNMGRRSYRGGADQPERRAHRRLKISEGSGWIQTLPQFSVIDISPSGIGLTANHPVQAGERIRISLQGGPSADAQVINCRPEETSLSLFSLEFRVGCQFVAANEGGRLVDEIEYQLASMMG